MKVEQKSLIQFSLRTGFLVVLSVSIMTSLIVPFFRISRESDLMRIVSLFVICTAMFSITAGVMCFFRLRIECHCGTRFELIPLARVTRKWRIGAVTLSIGFIASLAYSIATFPYASVPPAIVYRSHLLMLYGWAGIFSALVAYLLVKLWWGEAAESLEICRNGLVVKGLNYVKWPLKSDYRWYPAHGALIIKRKYLPLSIQIPQADRARTEAALRQYGGINPTGA